MNAIQILGFVIVVAVMGLAPESVFAAPFSSGTEPIEFVAFSGHTEDRDPKGLKKKTVRGIEERGFEYSKRATGEVQGIESFQTQSGMQLNHNTLNALEGSPRNRVVKKARRKSAPNSQESRKKPNIVLKTKSLAQPDIVLEQPKQSDSVSAEHIASRNVVSKQRRQIDTFFQESKAKSESSLGQQNLVLKNSLRASPTVPHGSPALNDSHDQLNFNIQLESGPIDTLAPPYSQSVGLKSQVQQKHASSKLVSDVEPTNKNSLTQRDIVLRKSPADSEGLVQKSVAQPNIVLK